MEKQSENVQADVDNTDTSADLPEPLFRALDASNVERVETSELESLCMSCGEMGITKLLLTKIPLFREVIVMSFGCPHCHYSNNEIQSGVEVQDHGIRYTVTVSNTADLNRMAVKADTASLIIPDLEFEIPPNTQKGSINTLEGFIKLSIEGLEQDQPSRRENHPEVAEQLDGFIKRLKDCLNVSHPFTMVIDDPSGNSFVENKFSPGSDPGLSEERYTRTDEQNRLLDIALPETQGVSSDGDGDTGEGGREAEESEGAIDTNEIVSFPTICSDCHSPSETRMKLIDIPFFKQVVVMATLCEVCGFRSNEVKSGAGVSEKGIKISLRITDPSDLSRDVLKAETASLAVPELELELQPGTLGGRFNTIEGLLTAVKEQLSGQNPFVTGDSASGTKMGEFIENLTKVIRGEKMGVHIIIDDPAGNSYMQNVYAPEDDPEMIIEHYQRTREHEDTLGLLDMNTENYTSS